MSTKNTTAQRSYAPIALPQTEQQRNGFSFGGFHHDRELGGLKWVLRCMALALIAMALANISLGIYAFVLKEREKITPWFIEVATTGEVRSIKRLGERGFEASELITQSFLKQVIQNIFAIPADPVVHKTQLLKAQSMTESQAAIFFNEWVRTYQPAMRGQQGEYVLVVVESIHKIAGSETYMADWYKLIYRAGVPPIKEKWRGSFHIQVDDVTKPRNDVDLDNPLNMRILDMNWDKVR